MHPGAQRRGWRLAGAFEWSDECGQHPRAMLLPEPSAQRRSYPKESRETNEKNERRAGAARGDACDHGRDGGGWRLWRRRRCVLRAAAGLILRRGRLVERRSARPQRRRARQPGEAERRHRVHLPIDERPGRTIERSRGGRLHVWRRSPTDRRTVMVHRCSNWGADDRRDDAARVVRATELHWSGRGRRDRTGACRWLLRLALDQQLRDLRRRDELGRLHRNLGRSAHHSCRRAHRCCRGGYHWFHGSGHGRDDLRRRGGDGLHDVRHGGNGDRRRRHCGQCRDHRNRGSRRGRRCGYRGRSGHLHGRGCYRQRRRRGRLRYRN